MNNEEKFIILKKLVAKYSFTNTSFSYFRLAKQLIAIYPTEKSWKCQYKQREINTYWPLDVEKESVYDGNSYFELTKRGDNLNLELRLYDQHFMGGGARGELRCTFITTINSYHEYLDKILEYKLNDYTRDVIEEREERAKKKLFEDTKQELVKNFLKPTKKEKHNELL